MKKAICILLAGILSFGCNAAKGDSAQSQRNTTNRDTLTIAMCGDIMMGTTYPKTELPANEGRDIFKDVADVFQKADLSIGNLEGTFLDGGRSTKGNGRYSFAFRTPTSWAPRLKEAGFDFMCQANNHARDFGEEGINMTEKLLDGLGIKYAGIKGHPATAIVEKNGVKYGICAFGQNSYTYKHTDFDLVARTVSDLRKQCDILVVTFHGGAEGSSAARLPEGTETYLGENRGNLRQFAHLCIDNGADVVSGHGPHVCRAMEVYKGKFIAYSLGNFATPYGMSLSSVCGYAPAVSIRILGDGTFVDGNIRSCIQQKGQGPRLDNTHAAAREISRLTQQDFANPGLKISDTGVMTKN